MRGLRYAAAVGLLTVALLAALMAVRHWADPWHQNYYMPGVDITSEGP